MTGTKDLLVIIGITGNQGGSVARTFLTGPELRSRYRIRGITRNISSAEARSLSAQGVEMVSTDLHDVKSLQRAFEGAHVIFSVTDFWKPCMNPQNQAKVRELGKHIGVFSAELEFEQGRNIADTASHVPGLQRLIVSMTCSPQKWSNGLYRTIYHFDAKANMIDYIKEKHPDLAVKMSELNMGAFFRAWKFAPIHAPNRQVDGSFLLALPCDPDVPIPFVDPPNDTGILVAGLLSLKPGVQLYGESETMTWNEWLALWGKTLGKEVRYKRLAVEDFEAELVKTHPPSFGTELGEMFEFMGEYGYDGGDPACKRRQQVSKIPSGPLGILC